MPSLTGPHGDGLIQCRASAAAALPGEHGDECHDTVRAIGEDSPGPSDVSGYAKAMGYVESWLAIRTLRAA